MQKKAFFLLFNPVVLSWLIVLIMKDNKESTLRNFEIVDRLKAIREELISMKKALDGFTYEQVDELKKDIQQG